jgi:hypothetical protein
MASNAQVKVWLSHDGYRDPDDNLAMLVGAAQAKAVDKGSAKVSLGSVVFGDTKDGGQFYMLNPTGSAPKSFGSDARYGDKAGNKVAAGNYEFYKDYGKAAIGNLGIRQFDLVAQDKGGTRAWNFDAKSASAVSSAAAALASDIKQAIAAPNAVVAYSAGGGANVAAEAIGLLLNQGYRKAVLIEHFAVVQHGRSNWVNQYEPEARAITREFTIAITNQNMAKYANGTKGPDLKNAIPAPGKIDGSAFGNAFDKALDVAVGNKAYGSALKAGTTFKSTRDASDAGSHAFAVDTGRLLAAWDKKLRSGDDLPSGDAWAHKIDGKGGDRLRVVFNDFDSGDIAKLLNGSKSSTTVSSKALATTPDSGATPDKPNAPRPDAGPDKGGDTGTGIDTGNDTGADKGGDGGVAAKGFVAPFATGGAAVAVDGATLYGFDAEGKAAAIGTKGGKVGVASAGGAHEIEHVGDGSEALGLDFGAAIDAITLGLAGLGSKAGAREGAKLVVYDADGDVLDSWVFTQNGTVTVELDAPARYAVLEATDWLGGDGPANSDPDFALVGLGFDYI